ncbi:hypothetical protein ACJMK2_042956 [Sinanodonta woodiana]|uniref:CCHC-type domain-containing protein n=1 Tax=Sinanodonta woodiana TaxID=1069815 RepID=A0ABD3VVG1_SINWO
MEFTDQEVQNILGAFKALKVKPRADTPEDFAKWMADFTASMGAFPVKEEPASSHATTSIASGHIHVTFPHELRISVFSGDRLKQTLKDVSGHKFDSLKTLDELRVALHELKQNKKTTHLNMASTSTTSQTKEISELKDLVQQLSQEVKFLKENSVSHLSNNQQSYGSRFRTDTTMKKRDRTCWRCGQVGHIASACRVRLDHSKRDLNSMRPMAGGKQ